MHAVAVTEQREVEALETMLSRHANRIDSFRWQWKCWAWLCGTPQDAQRTNLSVTNETFTLAYVPVGERVFKAVVQHHGLKRLCAASVLIFLVHTVAASLIGGWWAAVLLSLGAVVECQLLRVHGCGPGVVGVPTDSGDGQHETIDLVRCKLRCQFCKTCKVLRPPRTSHCRVCRACVAQFDHHCFVLGSCIGKENIQPFCLLLITLWIDSILFVAAGLSVENSDPLGLTVVVIVGTLCIVPFTVASLFYIRLYAVLGVTFREWNRRGEYYVGVELEESWNVVPRPFDLGLLANIKALFVVSRL